MTAKQNEDAIERRHNRLHEDDLQAMVLQITNALSNQHSCRFPTIKVEDMEKVIPFMLTFKGITEKTGMWVWKAIVLAIVATATGLAVLGFWTKVGK